MKSNRKRVLAHSFAVMLTAASIFPNMALAESINERPTAAAMALDLVVARPLLAVATVLGAGGFVISLPFSAIGGNVEEVGQKMVVTPFNATITRCLGCTRQHVGGDVDKSGY